MGRETIRHLTRSGDGHFDLIAVLIRQGLESQGPGYLDGPDGKLWLKVLGVDPESVAEQIGRRWKPNTGGKRDEAQRRNGLLGPHAIQ